MSQPGPLPRLSVVKRSQLLAALVLAAGAGYVGGWAASFPLSFYRSFPLPGHPWVAPLGAYDDHLTRDVGDLYLGLLVLTVWTVVRPTRELRVLTGSVWLVVGVPHLAFHAAHLDMLRPADRLGTLASLVATVGCAVLLMLPGRTS